MHRGTLQDVFIDVISCGQIFPCRRQAFLLLPACEKRADLDKVTWPRGVTVSTLDSESSDRGSNPREASCLHACSILHQDCMITDQHLQKEDCRVGRGSVKMID